MKIAITGASGFLGSALRPFLEKDGHEVVRLVRREPRGEGEVRWDPGRGHLDAGALEGVEAVFHLSGENIAAGRWTKARKARLHSSRVGSTDLLSRALAGLARRPRVLVCASGVGAYGDRGEEWVSEASATADDFLGRLSRDWEGATTPASAAGVRVVNTRFGLVLSPRGGALPKMLLPFRLGLGGVVGSGRQYMSWIALDDALSAFRHVLGADDLAGPVNFVSPQPVTNREFTKTLGRVLGRPTIAPVPAFALRLALGEMADATLLASTRGRPERLLATGFRFAFPDLEGALRHLLRGDGSGGTAGPGEA
jgi:hypothetical protein